MHVSTSLLELASSGFAALLVHDGLSDINVAFDLVASVLSLRILPTLPSRTSTSTYGICIRPSTASSVVFALG